MNENHTITLQDKKWGMPVRVLTLITFFLGAFTLVQAILLLSEYYSNYDVSMPVVILFLLITPFAFVAALMFAFGVHKIAQEKSNQEGLLPLVRAVRQKYPDKTIWCFTGYDFEKDILGYMMEEWETTKELLSYFDVMVDGEFQIEHKDLGLAFKGSSNQRTIMVQESLQKGRLCIWQPQ